MRSVTWNRFPIKINLLTTDSNSSHLRRRVFSFGASRFSLKPDNFLSWTICIVQNYISHRNKAFHKLTIFLYTIFYVLLSLTAALYSDYARICFQTRMTYYWRPIDGANFSVCFVYKTNMSEVTLRPEEVVNYINHRSRFRYHRLDLENEVKTCQYFYQVSEFWLLVTETLLLWFSCCLLRVLVYVISLNTWRCVT